MADQLNMNGLSLNGPHGQGRSAYIPPHMRGMPPPSMDGPPPPMNGHVNGDAWGGPTKSVAQLIAY
jgi:ATP-dependent RNA helicase DDX3X